MTISEFSFHFPSLTTCHPCRTSQIDPKGSQKPKPSGLRGGLGPEQIQALFCLSRKRKLEKPIGQGEKLPV